MPKLSGIFEQFSSLDQLPLEEISKSLSFKMDINTLANFLGNRILYPQSIPMTLQEMEIDLLIFREAVKLNPQIIYLKEKGITITEDLENRFKPLTNLIKVLIDVLPLGESTRVYLKNATGTTSIGSVIKLMPTGLGNTVLLEGQVYQLAKGTLTLIPCLSKNTQLTYDKRIIPTAGGRAGVFVDLRGKS